MARRVFTTRTCVRRRYCTETDAQQAQRARGDPRAAVRHCRDCGGWHLWLPDTALDPDTNPLRADQLADARTKLRRRWRRWRNR